MWGESHHSIEWEDEASQKEIRNVVDLLAVDDGASERSMECQFLIVVCAVSAMLLVGLCGVGLPAAWGACLARASVVGSDVGVRGSGPCRIVSILPVLCVDHLKLSWIFTWFFVSLVGRSHIRLGDRDGVCHGGTRFIGVLTWSIKCRHLVLSFVSNDVLPLIHNWSGLNY